LHRLNGRVRRLDHGDKDDRDARVHFADRLVDLQAGLVGQAQVQKDDVRRLDPDARQSFGAGGGHLDAVCGGGECQPHLLGDQGRVIVDE
jgi:hypothetical protein